MNRIYINEEEKSALSDWENCPDSILKKLGLYKEEEKCHLCGEPLCGSCLKTQCVVCRNSYCTHHLVIEDHSNLNVCFDCLIENKDKSKDKLRFKVKKKEFYDLYIQEFKERSGKDLSNDADLYPQLVNTIGFVNSFKITKYRTNPLKILISCSLHFPQIGEAAFQVRDKGSVEKDLDELKALLSKKYGSLIVFR